MHQDTPGPDPLRPGGPDEDLAAFASDLEDAPEDCEPAAGEAPAAAAAAAPQQLAEGACYLISFMSLMRLSIDAVIMTVGMSHVPHA